MTDATTTFKQVDSLPWIRNGQFDLVFIIGLFALACATGMVIIAEPALFYPILVIDLWVLGYHHVISTYTRLCFDKESFAEHKPLILLLLPAVVIGTLSAVWVFGLWVLVTVYFYWQWFHYVRQSWGISRAYRGKDRDAGYEDGWLDQAIFWSIPVFGIIWRSAEQQPTFIGMELWSVPVPEPIAIASGFIALALLAYWTVNRLRLASEGRLAIVHTLYMLTHFGIFFTAYIAIPDITLGWLMINIWHNAQYILFVWMFNNKRFASGVDPDAKFLSYISQNGRIWLYMAVCIAITGVIYWGVLRTLDQLLFAGLSATIVLYQIVNFHHYIVDSKIWKLRKPKITATLQTS